MTGLWIDCAGRKPNGKRWASRRRPLELGDATAGDRCLEWWNTNRLEWSVKMGVKVDEVRIWDAESGGALLCAGDTDAGHLIGADVVMGPGTVRVSTSQMPRA